jgi:hypothetical protein
MALALVAFAVFLLAWITVRKPPAERERAVPAVAQHGEVKAPKPEIDEDTRRVARARWENRREEIRAANERRAAFDALRSQTPASPASRECNHGDCDADDPEAAEANDDPVFASFIDQTTTLTQGCEELIDSKPASVRVTARLIGAPDVGTIVESIAASGPGEGMDALTECLTQGMYTLELDATETNFERDAVLMLGLLDEVAGEGWLTPERIAEIRQQMVDGGLDPDVDPMVTVDVQEPAPTP